MKKYTLRLVRLMFSLAVILALAMWFADAAHAQGQMPPMKGGEHMRMLSGIDTQAQAEELKPGDEIAMVCAKCKTVSVTLITKDNKNRVTVMTPGEKHLCPGCQGTMEVVGSGKGKHDVLKHTCSNCGSDSAFCCATSAKSSATKGMEKK